MSNTLLQVVVVVAEGYIVDFSLVTTFRAKSTQLILDSVTLVSVKASAQIHKFVYITAFTCEFDGLFCLEVRKLE